MYSPVLSRFGARSGTLTAAFEIQNGLSHREHDLHRAPFDLVVGIAKPLRSRELLLGLVLALVFGVSALGVDIDHSLVRSRPSAPPFTSSISSALGFPRRRPRSVTIVVLGRVVKCQIDDILGVHQLHSSSATQLRQSASRSLVRRICLSIWIWPMLNRRYVRG
jgi:hypothetical protein